MHTFDIPLSLKVLLIWHQKTPEMFKDSLELHSHNMCKEVLPKSCFAHFSLVCKNKFRRGKQMLCLVQTQSALVASQPRICWSHSDFYLIKSIASRPLCIPAYLCMVLLFFFYLLTDEIIWLRGYAGNMGASCPYLVLDHKWCKRRWKNITLVMGAILYLNFVNQVCEESSRAVGTHSVSERLHLPYTY